MTHHTHVRSETRLPRSAGDRGVPSRCTYGGESRATQEGGSRLWALGQTPQGAGCGTAPDCHSAPMPRPKALSHTAVEGARDDEQSRPAHDTERTTRPGRAAAYSRGLRLTPSRPSGRDRATSRDMLDEHVARVYVHARLVTTRSRVRRSSSGPLLTR